LFPSLLTLTITIRLVSKSYHLFRMIHAYIAAKEAVMLTKERVESLRSSLRGELIEPGGSEYDVARKVYNAMIDRHPRLIARCRDVADVITAVNFARDNDLLLAIRGGGHNAGGLGVCDDGLVIDLSRMKGVRVDPGERTVRVEGGCVWGDVDHATHAFGLATPSGIISTTGVAGLTLGGGIGHLTRKCGLAVDNLLEADLVLADGSFVTASTEKNPISTGRSAAAGGISASSPRFSSGCIPSTRSMPGRCSGIWRRPPT
jgi:FAD/FMN-containing dehydrogenase